MAEIDTVIEDERWADAGLGALVDRAASATLAWLEMEGDICVMGCDDARIAALNDDFRGKPRPTNVLSWPAHEHLAHPPGTHPPRPASGELGDIAISFDTCQAEAAAQQKSLADHVTHLLVHGILHLAGYDHLNDADAIVMEDAERVILATLGISDPYLEKTT